MSNVQEIPLSQLSRSPRNVRRTAADDGVEELAASIASHGLLQNLTVMPAAKPKGKRKGVGFDSAANCAGCGFVSDVADFEER